MKTRMLSTLKNERGLVDLQAVMVGVIVTGIVSIGSIASMMGFTQAISTDSSKMMLRNVGVAAENYYTEHDYYPASLQELADADLIPKDYLQKGEANGIKRICYSGVSSATDIYPQTYVASTYVPQSGKTYSLDKETRKIKQISTPVCS